MQNPAAEASVQPAVSHQGTAHWVEGSARDCLEQELHMAMDMYNLGVETSFGLLSIQHPRDFVERNRYPDESASSVRSLSQ